MRVIKLFISSTSDIALERERLICSDVLTQINSEHPDFKIELIKWETHSNPIVNTSYQEEINKELKVADIVCFVFYNRLGEHTKEEYDFVVENHMNRLVLQKEYSPKLSTLEIDEIETYIELRRFLLPVRGSVPVFVYENIDGFKNILRDSLGKFIISLKNIDNQAQTNINLNDITLMTMRKVLNEHPELKYLLLEIS